MAPRAIISTSPETCLVLIAVFHARSNENAKDRTASYDRELFSRVVVVEVPCRFGRHLHSGTWHRHHCEHYGSSQQLHAAYRTDDSDVRAVPYPAHGKHNFRDVSRHVSLDIGTSMTDGLKEERQPLGEDRGEWSIARMYCK